MCVERCRRVRRCGEQQEERVLKKAKKIKKNRAEGVLGLVRLECDVMGLNWEGSMLALGEAPGSSTDGFLMRRRGAVMGKPVVCEHHEDGGEKGNPVR